MNDMILKIKPEVETSIFDDGNDRTTYLVGMNNRYWKVSSIIYYVLCSIDGNRSIKEIKEYLCEEYSIEIEEKKLKEIINKAFVQNGILEGTTATTSRVKNKMLWGRFTLLTPKMIKKLKFFSFLFNKGCIITLSSVLVIWILYIISTNSNMQVINELFDLGMKKIVLCYLYLILAGFIHELGHSIATMSYGGEPGRIGAGVYIIMPVMFSDVTNVWNMKRQQRVVVDLGGMYLQGTFLVLSFILNMTLINSSLLTIAILISGFQILGNFNPFIKFDGYWVLSDYLGVTEIRRVIGQLWLDLLRKIFKKKEKLSYLNKRKKTVIYVYSIFTVVFFAYFFRFLISGLVLAVKNISSDILTVQKIGLLNLNISFNSIVHYISMRGTTIIILIFFTRLIWSYVLKKVIVRFKHRINRGKEETNCATD